MWCDVEKDKMRSLWSKRGERVRRIPTVSIGARSLGLRDGAVASLRGLEHCSLVKPNRRPSTSVAIQRLAVIPGWYGTVLSGDYL